MGVFITLEAAKRYLKSIAAFTTLPADGVTAAEVVDAEKWAEALIRQRLGPMFAWEGSVTSVDVDLNEIEVKGHELSTNDAVILRSNVTLPAPLVAGTAYFVNVVDEDKITLSTTSGGAVIDLTTEGSGVITVTRRLWTSAALTPALVRQAAELEASAQVLLIAFNRGGESDEDMSEAVATLRSQARLKIEACEEARVLFLDDGTPQRRLGSAGPACATLGGVVAW